MGRSLIALLITLVIISGLGFGGYTFYENMQLKEVLQNKEEKINQIQYENENLKYRINDLNELIQRYQKDNRKLAREIRDLKFKTKSVRDDFITKTKTNKIVKTKTTKKQTSNKQSYRKVINRNNTQNQLKWIYEDKPKKRYHKYNGYKKLKSDSKIYQLSDGRFKSNSEIYGIYKQRIINAQCGNNPKLYKVENECKAYSGTLYQDPIYFSKAFLNDLKTFDLRDHVIECHYNQQHGVMHNCRPVLDRYVYK